MRAKAYLAKVEALKPPDSELDDETRESFEEELSPSDLPDPVSSDEAEPRSVTSVDEQEIQNGDSSEILDSTRPKKKRRRS